MKRASIRTEVFKNCDIPEIIEFRVRAAIMDDDHENVKEELGYLTGFLYAPGSLPDEDDYGSFYFEIFDERSGHAREAFDVLAKFKGEIGKILKRDTDDFSGVLFLENAEVVAEHRGRGLALRLMREVLHLFGRCDLLVIARAHPTPGAATAAGCRKLARYYMSDKSLEFREISPRKLPGWLVTTWEYPSEVVGDEYSWRLG